MTVSPEVAVQRSVAKAREAYQFYDCAIKAFAAHINRYDYKSAEEERLKAHVALDMYLDESAMTQRLLEKMRP